MAITKEIISDFILKSGKINTTLSKLMRLKKDELLNMAKENDIVIFETPKEKTKKVDTKIVDLQTQNITFSSMQYNMFKEKNDKDIFEHVIDNTIIDLVAEGDDRVIQAFAEMSKDEKRDSILDLLDKDYSIYSKISKLIETDKINNIKEVINLLRQYVEVAATAVKTHGEVMTPFELVKDMLNTLPSDVWSNPNLKWLDPANGVGPFPALVIYKLMNGLKEWQPNDELRYKHIIENMIYVCELQPKNMFLWLCAIDYKDDYKTNIYCGSFLDNGFEYHMKEVWNVNKFDIIIGNPPYQELKIGNTKSQPLWHLFVEKSLDMLVKGGYITMVHPSGWRNVDGAFKKTQKKMLENNIIYLEIHSFKDGLKTFGAKIDYDFYLIQKERTNIKTKIKSIDGNLYNVEIFNKEFIPSDSIDRVYSLVAKNGEERVNIINNSSYHHQKEYMSKEKDNTYKYPCVYMVKSGLNIVCWFSNINNKGHFNLPKVIFGNGACDVMIDGNGEYGLTEFASGIVDSVENLENIKKCLDNKDFINNIMNYRDGLGNKYNRKVISLFRKDFWKEFI